MFSKSEMRTILQWLEGRKDWLASERLIIECGDDFAHTNGKWPNVENLLREEHALVASITTAKEQMEQANE
jgi:hypothetical protein